MTQEVEAILKEIGQYIARTIQDPWDRAWIEVEFQPGVIAAEGRYTATGVAKAHSFLVGGNVARRFARLRQLVKKDEVTIWEKARYTVHPDGEFRIDFDY